MFRSEIGQAAVSLDLDDVLIGRGIIVRLLGLITGKVKPHRLVIPSEIPHIPREIIDVPLQSWRERLSFEMHALRTVLPGVPEALEEFAKSGDDIYGNTGRSNKRVWVEMTQRSLERGGIADYFQDVFYTPDGIRTAISKAAGLKKLKERYGRVSHYEDDPRTAFILAQLFPDMDIYLVHYGTTGLLYSRDELERLPNLHRIAVLTGVKSR